MRLIGLMPCRNEAYVLGLSARVALMWCDELIVGLHNCEDLSETICDQIATDTDGRLQYVDLDSGSWDEMRHRQILLDEARKDGATHIAIIDADEVLTGNLVNDVRYAAMRPQGSILSLPGYNLRGGINRYHANGIWGARWFSTAFCNDPRLSWSGDKFHSREPQGNHLMPFQPCSQGQGGTMHLWGISERRLKAKHALYKLNERLRWPQKPVAEIERMYNWAIYGEPGHPSFGTPETWTYADVPSAWWSPYSHLMKYLDVDAEPWQEKACIEIIKEHGPLMFKGLDLFGVA